MDSQTDLLTNVVNARWSFVFDPLDDGNEHVHSIFLRISEHPNPGLLFQRFVSGNTEDLDSLDGEAFAPISRKIDFLENRFSIELLAVISEWLNALPKAEPTFGIIRWLHKHSDRVSEFVYSTFPPLAMIASVGIWMAYLPVWMNASLKVAVAWLVLTGALLLIARYCATGINRLLDRHLGRICNVPVFQITSGDMSRFTKYLAKSQRSAITLATGGLVYGAFKAAGLFLTGKLLTRLFS